MNWLASFLPLFLVELIKALVQPDKASYEIAERKERDDEILDADFRWPALDD